MGVYAMLLNHVLNPLKMLGNQLYIMRILSFGC